MCTLVNFMWPRMPAPSSSSFWLLKKRQGGKDSGTRVERGGVPVPEPCLHFGPGYVSVVTPSHTRRPFACANGFRRFDIVLHSEVKGWVRLSMLLSFASIAARDSRIAHYLWPTSLPLHVTRPPTDCYLLSSLLPLRLAYAHVPFPQDSSRFLLLACPHPSCTQAHARARLPSAHSAYLQDYGRLCQSRAASLRRAHTSAQPDPTVFSPVLRHAPSLHPRVSLLRIAKPRSRPAEAQAPFYSLPTLRMAWLGESGNKNRCMCLCGAT
ncbi:hypothetical protein DFH06DRAFT_170213 [Mycena polygramma]|nr:hypothetical protein DFH06DRAFT_170213 [Mycena polygramma]